MTLLASTSLAAISVTATSVAGSLTAWLTSMAPRLVTLAAVNALSAALLALLALGARRFTERASLRHALWLLVLLDLLTPPLLHLAVLPAPAPAASPVSASSLHQRWLEPSPSSEHAGSPASQSPASPSPASQSPALQSPASQSPASPSLAPAPFWLRRDLWTLALALAALGSLAMLVGLVAHMRRFGKLVAAARPAPQTLAARIDRLAAQIGLAHTPSARITDARMPPLVWSRWPRPILLLPSALVERLGADALDAVLAHELVHVARRDHWVRFVELVATVLYWWHPVLWWARRALHRDEERACDAQVVARWPELASAYARGLLETLAFLAPGRPPAATTAIAAPCRRDLEERLTMILRPRALLRIHPVLRLSFAALGAIALFVLPVRAGLPQAEAETEATPGPRAAMSPSEPEAEPEAEPPVAGAQLAALEQQLRALEDQARALEHQQRDLEQALQTMAYQRAELEAQTERLMLESQARALEDEHRDSQAQMLRRQATSREAEHRIERQRIERRQQALEDEQRARRAEQGAEARMRALERQQQDRAEAQEALERAGRHDQAEAMRQQAEAEFLLERARIEAERAPRQRAEVERALRLELSDLISQLEALAARTTSASEAAAIDDQLRALRQQLEDQQRESPAPDRED